MCALICNNIGNLVGGVRVVCGFPYLACPPREQQHLLVVLHEGKHCPGGCLDCAKSLKHVGSQGALPVQGVC